MRLYLSLIQINLQFTRGVKLYCSLKFGQGAAVPLLRCHCWRVHKNLTPLLIGRFQFNFIQELKLASSSRKLRYSSDLNKQHFLFYKIPLKTSDIILTSHSQNPP